MQHPRHSGYSKMLVTFSLLKDNKWGKCHSVHASPCGGPECAEPAPLPGKAVVPQFSQLGQYSPGLEHVPALFPLSSVLPWPLTLMGNNPTTSSAAFPLGCRFCSDNFRLHFLIPSPLVLTTAPEQTETLTQNAVLSKKQNDLWSWPWRLSQYRE